MRITHDEYLVGIHIAKEKKLADKVVNERIHINIVEPVPSVIRRAERKVKVASGLRMVLVVHPHLPPLAIVDLLAGIPAPVHGDEQRPAICRARADGLDRVRT